MQRIIEFYWVYIYKDCLYHVSHTQKVQMHPIPYIVSTYVRVSVVGREPLVKNQGSIFIIDMFLIYKCGNVLQISTKNKYNGIQSGLVYNANWYYL